LLQSDIANTLVNVKNVEEAVQRITSAIDKQQQNSNIIIEDADVISDDESNLLEGEAAGEDEDNESDSKEISSSEGDPEEISSFESDPSTPIEKKDARRKARKENKKKVKKERREKRKRKKDKKNLQGCKEKKDKID
jgi:RIO kinase 1